MPMRDVHRMVIVSYFVEIITNVATTFDFNELMPRMTP
jgi:hypothetical protein